MTANNLTNLIDISPFSYSVVMLYGVVLIKFFTSYLASHEPLQFYRLFCDQLAKKVNKSKNSGRQRNISGFIGILVTLTPLIIILWLFEAFVEATWLWQSFLLYLALGNVRLGKTSKEIAKLIVSNKNFEAKQLLNPLLLRDTEQLSSLGLAKSSIEMLLLRAMQNLFTIGFIFLIFGPLAALTSRLLIEMHYSWNNKQVCFQPFGNSIAFIVNIIQWLPNRIFSLILLFSCIGKNFILFFRLSRPYFLQLNNSYVLNLFALSLEIKLGGVAMYQGIKLRKTSYNDHGRQPQATDIIHANKRINQIFYFCFLFLALLSLFTYSLNING
jgi:adenosylcobinamide-phosphate synthase